MALRPCIFASSLFGLAHGAPSEFLAASKAQASATSSSSMPFATAAGIYALDQPDARIPVGGAVRVLAIGSSNTMWNTWIDQLHMMLAQLGYSVPLVDPLDRKNMTRPEVEAICDNNDQHSGLHTLRICKPGWSSWGFAYESNADCSADGFRIIQNVSVSCTNGWMCRPEFVGSEPFVRPSDVATISAGAEVVVLSNWQNDATARYPGNICYKGPVLAQDDVSLTVDSLRRTVKAIHDRKPEVAVVVMAKYPGAAGRVVGSDPRRSNAAVKAGLADMPNTFFADFDFPIREDMYLTFKSGHPNCRGDKVIASAIVDALYRGRFLSRGLALGSPEECLGNSACAALSPDCCQRSALCWPSPEGICMPYSPGREPM